LDLTLSGIPGDIPGEPFLAGFHEVLEPGIVSTGAYAFPAAEVPDGDIAPEAFQYDAYLLFSGKLAAGDAFNISNELLGVFGSGFRLPEAVRYSLSYDLLLSLLDYFTSPGEQEQVPKCPVTIVLVVSHFR
jgi:hypothetical protein